MTIRICLYEFCVWSPIRVLNFVFGHLFVTYLGFQLGCNTRLVSFWTPILTSFGPDSLSDKRGFSQWMVVSLSSVPPWLAFTISYISMFCALNRCRFYLSDTRSGFVVSISWGLSKFF